MAPASAPGGSWSVAASAMSGGTRLTGRHPYHGRGAREYRRTHGREDHDGDPARRVPGRGGRAADVLRRAGGRAGARREDEAARLRRRRRGGRRRLEVDEGTAHAERAERRVALLGDAAGGAEQRVGEQLLEVEARRRRHPRAGEAGECLRARERAERARHRGGTGALGGAVEREPPAGQAAERRGLGLRRRRDAHPPVNARVEPAARTGPEEVTPPGG